MIKDTKIFEEYRGDIYISPYVYAPYVINEDKSVWYSGIFSSEENARFAIERQLGAQLIWKCNQIQILKYKICRSSDKFYVVNNYPLFITESKEMAENYLENSKIMGLKLNIIECKLDEVI